MAHQNSNSIEKFDFSTQAGKLKVGSWNFVLQKIKTKYLVDLYQYTEGYKTHSGMVTPADMVKAWREYSNHLASSQRINHKMIENDESNLQKIYKETKFYEQRKHHKNILENFQEWIPLYQKGNYLGSTNDCGCRLQNNPMYIYRHYSTQDQKCLWCLVKYLKIT